MDTEVVEHAGPEPGVAIEGASAIRHELDRVDLHHAVLYIEDRSPDPLPATEGARPGAGAGDGLVEEITARTRAGDGRVVHVPDGTFADADAVMVVQDDAVPERER